MRFNQNYLTFGGPRIAYSPPDDFGGGGGGPDDSDLDLGDPNDAGGGDGGDDDIFGFNTEDLDGFEGDDTITDDADRLLSQFWRDDASPNNGNGTQGNGNQGQNPQEVQAAIAQEMENSLNAMGVPEDLIPADFNPADPRQFREVLTQVQRATARETIRTMFRPVQAALGGIVTQLRQEMQQASSGAVNQQKAERMLSDAIPAFNSAGTRPVVQMLFEKAQNRFPGDLRKQVIATKKAAAAMNLRGMTQAPTRNGRTGNGRSQQGEMLTGSKALDVFATLPVPKQSQTQRSRGDLAANRMRRG